MNGNSFFFDVKDGVVAVWNMRQFQQRGDYCLQSLKMLVERSPDFFEGKQGIVHYEDHPPPAIMADLHFSVVHDQGVPGWAHPFPCWTAIGWPEVRIPSGDELLERLLASELPPTDPRMFWIGANTHPVRVAICRMAKEHPDKMHANIMAWNRGHDGRPLPIPHYLSLEDHARYKYLIDCQGVGYSTRLKWLLATGRPVFVVDRKPIEVWHRRLVPWEHFVPVRSDLRDLLSNYRLMEQDPALYDSIARNARRFAREHLPLRRQLDAITASLR